MATYSNMKDTLPEEILCIRLIESSEITGLWHLLIAPEEKGSKKKKGFFKIRTTDSMHLQVISFSINIVVFSSLFFMEIQIELQENLKIKSKYSEKLDI